MKSLSIFFALFTFTLALNSYATEPTTEQKKADEKVNTLEYKAPELKKPVVDPTKPDDSKVLGDETPKPVEKPKNKIEKERVMRTCGNCGFSLPEGVTKCPECGKNVCKNCGNILGVGVTKCPKCGEPTMLGSLQSVGCFMTFIGFFIILIIIVFSIK